jgi:putative peptidoglycan lipid II flippase
MCVVLFLLKGADGIWYKATTWMRVLHMSALVAAGAGSYFGVLWLLGFRLSQFDRRET